MDGMYGGSVFASESFPSMLCKTDNNESRAPCVSFQIHAICRSSDNFTTHKDLLIILLVGVIEWKLNE